MIDAFYIRKDHVKVEKENQTGSVNLSWTISRKKYIFLFYFLTIYPRLIYMKVLFFVCARVWVIDVTDIDWKLEKFYAMERTENNTETEIEIAMKNIYWVMDSALLPYIKRFIFEKSKITKNSHVFRSDRSAEV